METRANNGEEGTRERPPSTNQGNIKEGMVISVSEIHENSGNIEEKEDVSIFQPITKKNSKRQRRIKKKKQPKSMLPEPASSVICQKHERSIEFLCTFCFQELCGHCILNHTEHINSIKGIQTLIKSALVESGSVSADKLRINMVEMQSVKLTGLESLFNGFHSYFGKKLAEMKSEIIENDIKLKQAIDDYGTFIQRCQNCLVNSTAIDAAMIESMKTHLEGAATKNELALEIDEQMFLKKLDDTLNTTVRILPKGVSNQTTAIGAPKILHWFEWGKRTLYLYDIVKMKLTQIDLVINFKIPSFSRSLVTPQGHVYLMGGEEPELTPRRENYMFDLNSHEINQTLHVKEPMPKKKYDFSYCFLRGYIYVISGRDESLEIVDSCDRYHVDTDSWSPIAPVKRKRFAASASALELQNKIFLFGGRADATNRMLEDIEQYDVKMNVWTLVKLKNPNVWNPVEVCAMIPIDSNRILIFGGSDVRIRDSARSYIFDSLDNNLEMISELKKSQVFVSAPFLYGNYVYAVGNEYYVKTRNLNRFNIKTLEWDIIF